MTWPFGDGRWDRKGAGRLERTYRGGGGCGAEESNSGSYAGHRLQGVTVGPRRSS